MTKVRVIRGGSGEINVQERGPKNWARGWTKVGVSLYYEGDSTKANWYRVVGWAYAYEATMKPPYAQPPQPPTPFRYSRRERSLDGGTVVYECER